MEDLLTVGYITHSLADAVICASLPPSLQMKFFSVFSCFNFTFTDMFSPERKINPKVNQTHV